MQLILASQSPRRAELLDHAGFDFTIRPASIDESLRNGEDAEVYVKRLAQQKAAAIESAPDDVILAADTVVVIDGTILGKPVDKTDARRMLTLLSGRKHTVLTAVCIKRGPLMLEETASTTVWFSQLETATIAQYVDTGEPMDKAGAYAIQGIASRFIERIDGSYSNVVGLPIAVVHRLLLHANLSV